MKQFHFKGFFRWFLSPPFLTSTLLQFVWHVTFRALCCWDITFRQPVTAAKFIIKSSLFVQKFKDAGQTETDDWLCY
jgi:hypothetical protein